MKGKEVRRVRESIQVNLRYIELTECLVWVGRKDEAGRPVLRVGPERTPLLVRVFIYEALSDTRVGTDEAVLPTCGTPLCCQGEHLTLVEVEAGDIAGDIIISPPISPVPAIISPPLSPPRNICSREEEDLLKSTCPAGHDYTPENTVLRRNGRGVAVRACRLCIRDANKRSAAKRKDQVK